MRATWILAWIVIGTGGLAMWGAEPKSPAPAKYPVVWCIDQGLQTPESAYFDAESGFLFLSQIGAGGAVTKDGNGRISKLTVEGKLIKDKWVTGLNSPKGLRSY